MREGCGLSAVWLKMAEDSGVDFPLDAEGKRSTTGLNQGAFAAAVKAHSAEAHEESW